MCTLLLRNIPIRYTLGYCLTDYLDYSNMYLDLLPICCLNITYSPSSYLALIAVIIDRFVMISIDRCCCCCCRTEKTLTMCFARVSIVPIPPNMLGEEIGTHRQFHPLISGYNSYRYLKHQAVDRPTGEFNRLCTGLYSHRSKQYIDRLFHIPIGQTIGINRQFQVPVGYINSKRYRSAM